MPTCMIDLLHGGDDMKECKQCGEVKCLDEFYKNNCMADGHLNKCKVCFSLYKKEYWKENKEKLQEYKRKHRQENAEHYREYAKSYREKNIDEIKKKEKERRKKRSKQIRDYERRYAKSERGREVKRQIQNRYLSTERGREQRNQSSKRYVENNPVKKKCHTAVRLAIKSGHLTPAEECERCGDMEVNLHAHHDDYSMPLSVRWLCPMCHAEWHKENGEGLNSNH